MAIKYKKPHIGDTRESTFPLRQQPQLRLAKITSVDPSAGTCSISWLDMGGGRVDVVLTQFNPTDSVIPAKNTVALIMLDAKERAWIVGYIPVGIASRQINNDLPELKEGDRVLEAGGSFIFMRANGTIQMSTPLKGNWTLDAISSTLKYEVVNWRVRTDAGNLTFGRAKRNTVSATGGVSFQEVLSNTGFSFNEFVVEVFEDTAPKTPISQPIAKITMGTVINKVGVPESKDPLIPPTPTQQIAFQIKITPTDPTKSSVTLSIDKKGATFISVPTKLNIGNGAVDPGDLDLNVGDKIGITNPIKGDHAARENDVVTIPFGVSSDSTHPQLASLGIVNLGVLQDWIFNNFMYINAAGTPTPLMPSITPVIPSSPLQGAITSGSKNVYIGDGGIL